MGLLAAVTVVGMENQWLPLTCFIHHHIHKKMLLKFTLHVNPLGILLKMQVLIQ